MQYAPVAITTLCRSQHFRRCLISLAANTCAKSTDVYIGLDYPVNESHRKGYEEICSFLASFDSSSFHRLVVFRRKRNFGAVANARDVLDYVLARYDRYVFVEDDIEFAPCYLEYVNTLLEKYEGDERVECICGYSYPLAWQVRQDANAFFCNSTYSAWGAAGWKDRYIERKDFIESGGLDNAFEGACRTGIINKLINNRLVEYVMYSGIKVDPGISRRCMDITSGIYLMIVNRSVVIPTVSLTRNWGFDGSGVYCSKIVGADGKNSQSYDYSAQPLLISEKFEPVVDETPSSESVNGQLLNDFLYVPKCKILFAKFVVSLVSKFGLSAIGPLSRIIHALTRLKRR